MSITENHQTQNNIVNCLFENFCNKVFKLTGTGRFTKNTALAKSEIFGRERVGERLGLADVVLHQQAVGALAQEHLLGVALESGCFHRDDRSRFSYLFQLFSHNYLL